MISSVLVSLIFKDIRLVPFILSQRSIYDTFSATGSVSFNLSQFVLPRSIKINLEQLGSKNKLLTDDFLS